MKRCTITNPAITITTKSGSYANIGGLVSNMRRLCLILGALVTAAVWYVTQLLFVKIDDLTATGNAYWLLIQSVIILLPWVLITGKIYGNNDSWWWGSFAFFGTLRAFLTAAVPFCRPHCGAAVGGILALVRGGARDGDDVLHGLFPLSCPLGSCPCCDYIIYHCATIVNTTI